MSLGYHKLATRIKLNFTMAQRVGLPEFCPNTDSITHYLQRVELYFTAHDVKKELEVATLLSLIGTARYAHLCDLMVPTVPGSKKLDDITAVLKKHFEATKVQIAKRFHFRKRDQAAGETIANYDATLRKLAVYCNFGANLEDELRDHIVCGLRNESLQCRLRTEVDLTYKKVMDMAQATELADKNAKALRGSSEVHYIPHKSRKSPSHTVSQTKPQGQPRDCYRCGEKHTPWDCKFKDQSCRYCKKLGHIAKVCHKKAQQQKMRPDKRPTNKVKQSEDLDDSHTLHHMEGKGKSQPPYIISVSLDGRSTQMEVDTSATLSLMSETTYRKLWKVPPNLKLTTARLSTYSGQRLVVLGTLSVEVKYEAQQVVLSILVVQGSGPTLLGRDWLKHIQLNWKELSIHYTRKYRYLDEVLAKHESLFRPERGKAEGIEAKLYLDPEAIPRFYKAHPVQYALREKIENELQRLETEEIIKLVQMSDWAAPIVLVLKRDGSVIICGVYKLAVNQAAKLDPYPLPRIEDLFSRLSAGKRFTKLDIAHAYQQIPLVSKYSVSINTHKELFRYNRLPFGVHSAPAIFQRAIEGLLSDIPSTVVYNDDILITGETEEEHLHNINTVMSRLKQAALTLRKSKCHFLLEKVEYLGHNISEKGLQPTDDKIRAIRDAPVPQNVTQLRSFLGMVSS